MYFDIYMKTLVLETKLRRLVRNISLNTMEKTAPEMYDTNLRMFPLGLFFSRTTIKLTTQDGNTNV